MTRKEVGVLFQGITCPHCKMTVDINSPTDDLDERFPFFKERNTEVSQECAVFNNELNNKLFALRAGKISHSEFQSWAAQYRPR